MSSGGKSLTSRLGIRRALLNLFAAGILAGGCAAAGADEGQVRATDAANSPPVAHALPGRIYTGWRYAAAGIPDEIVSVNPNTGDWRVEVKIKITLASFMRISPSARVAAYQGCWPGVQSSVKVEIVCCPLDDASKEAGILSCRDGGGRLAWAPDGNRLLATTSHYKVVNMEGILRTEAWLVNADGSGKKRLPLPDTHELVDWSADGKLLLTTVPIRTQPYKSRAAFPRHLYLMNADGSRVRQVEAEDEQCDYGRFSPDSKWIAYGGVTVVSAAGTGRKEITHATANGIPGWACWSPDGKYVAVEVQRRLVDSWGRESVLPGAWIEIYDLAGKKIRTVEPRKGETRWLWETASLDWR